MTDIYTPDEGTPTQNPCPGAEGFRYTGGEVECLTALPPTGMGGGVALVAAVAVSLIVAGLAVLVAVRVPSTRPVLAWCAFAIGLILVVADIVIPPLPGLLNSPTGLTFAGIAASLFWVWGIGGFTRVFWQR